jgi:hypothetical protein
LNREDLHDMWKEWWRGDIWIASWEKGLAGITPEQALWTPEGGAHCIWQLVRHVIFWRDVTLGFLRGGDRPTDSQLATVQFSCPSSADAEGWAALKNELRASHDAILAALGGEAQSDERVRYHLAHDAYHLGQIMYLRRMLGFEVVMPP